MGLGSSWDGKTYGLRGISACSSLFVEATLARVGERAGSFMMTHGGGMTSKGQEK